MANKRRISHGIVRSHDLGLSRAGISKRVEAGRLYRRYRGVYSLLPEVTLEGEWLAAVYAAGGGAALTALNAIASYVDVRFKPVGITVAVPKRRRSQGFTLIAGLDPRDVRVRNDIPTVCFERALIDLRLQPEQTASIIYEGAHRRCFSAAATRRLIERTPGRHGKLERAIAMHEAGSAGTRSWLEDRFLALVRGARFPEPVINTHIRGIEVDFRWGDFCVEVDGPNHLRPATQAADLAKQARLEAHGMTVVRFNEAMIDHEPRALLGQLAAQQLARRVAWQ